MGRSAESWKLKTDPRTGIRSVRFRHNGKRYDRSTGERDLAAARREAATIYARVVTGKDAARVAGSSKLSLRELLAAFFVDIKGQVSTDVQKNYEWLAFGHIEPHFETFGGFTRLNIANYYRVRLRKVLRQSLRPELTVIRRFLSWAVEKELLAEVPVFPPLPKADKGTRALNRKEKAVQITGDEARAILAALPERSRIGRFPIRARFIVQWETSLRQATIGRLRVPEHYQKGAATLTITDPIDKAEFGRELPLTDAARAALDGVCPDVGLIFGEKEQGVFSRYIRRAAVASGLPPTKAAAFSAYDFRHGRITDLLGAGVPLPAVAYLAGHTQLTTTNRYVQVAQAERLAHEGLRRTGGISGGEPGGETEIPAKIPAKSG